MTLPPSLPRFLQQEQQVPPHPASLWEMGSQVGLRLTGPPLFVLTPSHLFVDHLSDTLCS